MKKPVLTDASIIVTLHNEGLLAYKTLRNIKLSVERALTERIRCEIVIGLDRADSETERVALQFKDSNPSVTCTILYSDYGDLGLNRNNLIDNSEGEYILIHDGDDFFTQNFLVEAHKLAAQVKTETVYVAQFLINFDAQHYMSFYIPSDSRTISKRFFFETNYYTSQYLLPRSLFEKVRYQKTADGYGYEDWWLNTTLLHMGVEFRVVPDTIFFYRRKKTGSLLAQSNNDSVLIHKTPFFEPGNFLRLSPKQNYPASIKLSPHADTSSASEKIRQRLSKHQLVYRYTRSVWHAHKSLADGVKDKLRGGNAHRSLTKDSINPHEIVARNEVELPSRMTNIGVTRKLVNEWGNMNTIEPLIRASWDMFEFIPIISYPIDSGLSNAYYDFCEKYQEYQFDDLIFVPHMIRGGAELATIHLVGSLCRKGRKVLVVGVLDSESPWASRINEIKGAVFVENKEILKHAPGEDERLLFWARVVQYWNVKTITTINSEFGYKFIHRYHRQLRAMSCSTYVHAFAYDVTEDGFIYNFIPNGLVEIYPSVSRYITDSDAFKQQLIDINGFEEKKINTLYLPSNLKIKRKKDFTRKNRVLFAGRIGYQKLAEIAVEVGAILGKEEIELHFFGSIEPEYIENDKFLKMIEPYSTIQYHGTFNGAHTLDFDDYDMFLLTTRTEGIPNAILEACSANIFIITAAVGGLPETIAHGDNGLLVDDDDKFNPEEYAKAIRYAYSTAIFSNQKKINNSNRQIKKRHSIDIYDEMVSTVMKIREYKK